MKLGKPIAFYPQLATELGGIKEALYYQQIYYWSDKGSRPDGFIYKTKESIQEETTLTREEQDRIRPRLVEMGWLEVQKIPVKGKPTLHYRPLKDLEFHISGKPTNVTKVENPLSQKRKTHECVICSTESTTENTNTGAENDSAPVSLSGDKSKKATVPAAQLKTVLRAFWITLGKPQWSDNDRNRHRGAAKELLEYFIKYPIAGQDADASAVNCIEAVAASLDHEGMTWSAQAITRWMSNYKLQLDTWGEYKGIHAKVEPKGGEQ